MNQLLDLLNKLYICQKGQCVKCIYKNTMCTDALIDDAIKIINNYVKEISKK